MSRELLLQAIARGWCSPEKQHKEMDASLTQAICSEIEAVLANPAPAQAEQAEQAQTAVGLPEPDGYVAMFPTGSKIVPPQEARAHVRSYPFYTADQMESYATAKTAEAVALYQEQVRELVSALRMVLDDPESLDGRPRTYAAVTDVLTKYAPKKEQDNG